MRVANGQTWIVDLQRAGPLVRRIRIVADRIGQITGLYLLPMLAGVRNPPSEAEIGRDVDEIVAEFVAARRPKS